LRPRRRSGVQTQAEGDGIGVIVAVLKNESRKTLQEARMEFRGHFAVVTAVTLAGAASLPTPGSGARNDEGLQKVDDSYLAWRDASTTWGDARLLPSIYLATE
jgi:hypothetical protein